MEILDIVVTVLFVLLLIVVVAGFNRQQAEKHELRMKENEIRTKKIEEEKIKKQNEISQEIYEKKSSKNFDEK